MKQYIDKDALVAEIEEWIELLTNEKNQEGVSQIDKLSLGGRIAELQEVKVFINTIEVKEVDLGEEIMKYQREIYDRDTTVRDVAKHFFEFGFKAQKGE